MRNPFKMTIQEQKPTLDLLHDLQESLHDKYQGERKGVHISDLVLCPRESIFRRLDPQPLSTTELMFFSMGAGHHTVLQTLAKWFGRKRTKTEKRISYKGVTGHVDLVVDGIPIEIKTTRAKEHKARYHYVEQLKLYMSIMGAKIGKILSISLTNYEHPFTVFDIRMNDQEIKNRLAWIESESKQYKLALEKKDWKLVRCVKEDINLNWKCERCVYRKMCWEHENAKTNNM